MDWADALGECSLPLCGGPGGKSCAICGTVNYCGSVCQKKHWKIHRSVCLKKLTDELLPYEKVLERINQITKLWVSCEAKKNTHDALKVLKYLLAFAEQQYGEAQPGMPFRERPNGDRVDNMVADIELWQISSTLGNRLYNLRTSDSYREAEVYFLKARYTLERWRFLFDSSDGQKDVTKLLEMLSITERYLADLYASQGRFQEAEYHCAQCLEFAKQTIGDHHTIELFKALRTYGYLLERQSNYSQAIAYFEDAYICVSEAFGPVHPRVQEAAGYLTDSLLQSKDFSRAEAYARINYESLIDPHSGISPESFEVARGAQQLAQICYMTPQNLGIASVSFAEGEFLARKALRVFEAVFDPFHINVGSSLNDLAKVLHESGNIGDETKGLYRRALAVYQISDGPDALLVMEANANLGLLHYQRGKAGCDELLTRIEFRFSKRYYDEALRISLITVDDSMRAVSAGYMSKVAEIPSDS